MENYSFITNNCIGSEICKKLNREYDNPFIGSYFQDDDQFLKFCSNFEHYINLKPEFLVAYSHNQPTYSISWISSYVFR